MDYILSFPSAQSSSYTSLWYGGAVADNRERKTVGCRDAESLPPLTEFNSQLMYLSPGGAVKIDLPRFVL